MGDPNRLVDFMQMKIPIEKWMMTPGTVLSWRFARAHLQGVTAGVLSSRSLFPTYFVDIFGPEYATNGLTVLAESS